MANKTSFASPCRDITTIKLTTRAKIDEIREDEELLSIDDNVLKQLVTILR